MHLTGFLKAPPRDAVNRETRDGQILSLRVVVLRIARRLANASIARLYPDFVQAGWIGAIQAVDAFDPAKRIDLGYYASFRIRGAIIDFMRTGDHLSRSQRDAIDAGEAAGAELPPLSLDTVIGLAGNIPDPHALEEMNRVVGKVDAQILLRALPDRTRHVVFARYWREEETLAIARRLRLTQGRVSQLHTEALVLARERLAAA